MAHASLWRSPDDQKFLDSVTTRDLRLFRDSMFPKPFIEANPAIFLDSQWVDIDKLKLFLVNMADQTDIVKIPLSTIKTEHSDTASISAVKTEPHDPTVMESASRNSNRVKTCVFKEDGHDIIEILSDSDADGRDLSGDELDLALGEASSGWESEPCTLPPQSDSEGFSSECPQDNDEDDSSDISRVKDMFDPADFILPSETDWQDPAITSTVINQKTRITSAITVDRIEYLTVLPSLWPIPRIPTAFVLDLRGSKYNFLNKKTGKPFSPDALIKNKDQDSWIGGTGTADSTARVTFSPGSAPILDPTSREQIVAAQRKTRQEEGNSSVKRTVTFFNVIKSQLPCEAENHFGKQCRGKPMMRKHSGKVDNASSTRLLLKGKSPGEYNPALQDKQIKRSIFREVKHEKHPAGLGIPGVIHLHMEDLKKPIDRRYIHKVVMSDDGGILVFTFVPFLLGLIHQEEVTAFECDVTFKHVQQLNEWEMRLTQIHTGKEIGFKRFTPGGNLLVMNADMEAAQILAAGISFLQTNDPTYSMIETTVPEEFVQYFVRVCLTHGKRAVLDFKPLVSPQVYQRLINFPYLRSQEELDEFTSFVRSLKIKKIE
ncbi:hypothetical protein C0992_006788, partial [Termitomyces sp. T32_za158]